MLNCNRSFVIRQREIGPLWCQSLRAREMPKAGIDGHEALRQRLPDRWRAVDSKARRSRAAVTVPESVRERA